MSFINLMASDVWSGTDISNRVQAIIRSRYSAEDELKAMRLFRKPDASADELAFIANVDAVISKAVEQGHQARLDNALLINVLAYEQAERRLAQYRLAEGLPEVTEERPGIDEEGNPITEIVVIRPAIARIEEGSTEWPMVIQDEEERTQAQSVIDGASAETIELANKRREPKI